MKEKNRDKDRWLSAIRAPYERVFAYRNKNSLSRVSEGAVSSGYSCAGIQSQANYDTGD